MSALTGYKQDGQLHCGWNVVFWADLGIWKVIFFRMMTVISERWRVRSALGDFKYFICLDRSHAGYPPASVWWDTCKREYQHSSSSSVSPPTCSGRSGPGKCCPGWRGWWPPSAPSPCPPPGSRQTFSNRQTIFSPPSSPHSPVVDVEFFLFEKALRSRVLGLHPVHELVELPPLLPHGAGHVLRDLIINQYWASLNVRT